MIEYPFDASRRFGFDRYCIGEPSKFPDRSWRDTAFGGVYTAKTARDALDAFRSDYPWKVLRLSDLVEIDHAELLRSMRAQARAQDPSLSRAEGFIDSAKEAVAS